MVNSLSWAAKVRCNKGRFDLAVGARRKLLTGWAAQGARAWSRADCSSTASLPATTETRSSGALPSFSSAAGTLAGMDW